MTLDARHRERELVLAHFLMLSKLLYRNSSTPPTPTRRAPPPARPLIAAGEALVIGAQEIVALVGRDRVAVGLPAIGEDLRCAVLVEPADLGVAQQEDSAQHELA
jgi:hypothetical protein